LKCPTLHLHPLRLPHVLTTLLLCTDSSLVPGVEKMINKHVSNEYVIWAPTPDTLNISKIWRKNKKAIIGLKKA
jgi:hypothetical protein